MALVIIRSGNEVENKVSLETQHLGGSGCLRCSPPVSLAPRGFGWLVPLHSASAALSAVTGVQPFNSFKW